MNWKYLLLVAPMILVGIVVLHLYVGIELLRDADSGGIAMLVLAVIYAVFTFIVTAAILEYIREGKGRKSEPKLKIKRRSQRERDAFRAGAKAAIAEFEDLFQDENLNFDFYTRSDYRNGDGKVIRDYEVFDAYDFHWRGQRAVQSAIEKSVRHKRIDS